jgi:hypothetical protein
MFGDNSTRPDEDSHRSVRFLIAANILCVAFKRLTTSKSEVSGKKQVEIKSPSENGGRLDDHSRLCIFNSTFTFPSTVCSVPNFLGSISTHKDVTTIKSGGTMTFAEGIPIAAASFIQRASFATTPSNRFPTGFRMWVTTLHEGSGTHQVRNARFALCIVTALIIRDRSGSSSVAERQLPKLNVAGSIPVSRSSD